MHWPPPFPFALIPAAGLSRRMGAPKLLLDAGGQTVIARLLGALGQAGVNRRIVIVSPGDDPLRREVDRHGGEALVPAAPPPDMRDSVSLGVRFIADEHRLQNEAASADSPWLLVPADHPAILPEVVVRLLSASGQNPGRIVVPTHGGRRGHPTIFAWKHALEIDAIPAGRGPNWLLQRHAADVREIAVDSNWILLDLDTPADYARLRANWPA